MKIRCYKNELAWGMAFGLAIGFKQRLNNDEVAADISIVFIRHVYNIALLTPPSRNNNQQER